MYKPICDQSSSSCCTESKSYVDTAGRTGLCATSAGHRSIQAQVGLTAAQDFKYEALYLEQILSVTPGKAAPSHIGTRYIFEGFSNIRSLE